MHPPTDCKNGGMPILLLIQIRCRWCGLVFCICRVCFRGHAYCSDPCRIAGKRKKHCEAQRRYRRTAKGKKAHREAENRRRHGLSKNNRKNMDDASSTVMPAWVMKLLCKLWGRIFHEGNRSYCLFCGCEGQIISQFPRRGYG
jgi:hypothetical protein